MTVEELTKALSVFEGDEPILIRDAYTGACVKDIIIDPNSTWSLIIDIDTGNQ